MFARVLNGVVVETFASAPVLHPDFMAMVFPAPGGVQQGWMTPDGGQTFAAPPAPVVAPPLTPAQLAQGLIADQSPTGTFARGLVALLATRFGLTQAQVITAIANAAS